MENKRLVLNLEAQNESKDLCINLNMTLVLISILLNCAFINVLLLYPQGIQSNLMEDPYNFSTFEYGVYYSIYCLPSIVSPLIFGFYLDKNGIQLKSFLMISFLNVSGLIIEAIGAYFFNFYLMILGRFIIGGSNECNSFLGKRLLLLLFTKKEMILIWGLYLFALRIGSSFGSGVAPYLYDLTNNIPILYIFTVIIGILIGLLMLYGYFKIQSIKELSNRLDKIDNELIYWKDLLLDFMHEAEKIVWIAIAMIVLNFMRLSAFMSEMNKIIMEETSDTETQAANYIILYDFLLGVFQIFFSYVFSKTGYYILQIFIGSPNVIIAITFFLPAYTSIDANDRIMIAIVWISLAYSLESNFMFSCLGCSMPAKYYGMTYGIFQSCINIGSLSGTLIFSLIREYSGNYILPLCETLALEFITLMTAITIFVLDRKNKRIFSKKA